ERLDLLEKGLLRPDLRLESMYILKAYADGTGLPDFYLDQRLRDRVNRLLTNEQEFLAKLAPRESGPPVRDTVSDPALEVIRTRAYETEERRLEEQAANLDPREGTLLRDQL